MEENPKDCMEKELEHSSWKGIHMHLFFQILSSIKMLLHVLFFIPTCDIFILVYEMQSLVIGFHETKPFVLGFGVDGAQTSCMKKV